MCLQYAGKCYLNKLDAPKSKTSSVKVSLGTRLWRASQRVTGALWCNRMMLLQCAVVCYVSSVKVLSGVHINYCVSRIMAGCID
jgi:hypothetical protein